MVATTVVMTTCPSQSAKGQLSDSLTTAFFSHVNNEMTRLMIIKMAKSGYLISISIPEGNLPVCSPAPQRLRSRLLVNFLT